MIRNIVPNFNVKFKNNHVVYETFIKCTVKDYEFNASYNPTLLSGSQGIMTPYSSSASSSIVYITPQDNYGILKDFATGSISGSEFSPYVTTVGLYNDADDLLAVGKMAAPMPLSANTDVTFLIKWDLNFTDEQPLSCALQGTAYYVAGTPTPTPTVTPTPTATNTPTPTPTGSLANIYAKFGADPTYPTTGSVYYQVNAGAITFLGYIVSSSCTQFTVTANTGDTLSVGLQVYSPTGSLNANFGAAPSASCTGTFTTTYCGTGSMFSHVIGIADYDISISGKVVGGSVTTC